MKYNKELDYCTKFPDKIFDVNYNHGCYLHDRHYRNERKHRFTRKNADKLLRDIVYRKFADKNKKVIGFIWSRIMYIGVRLLAKKYWVK